MADDEHADGSADHADGEVAAWLQVGPLDDVTRRRLVATALRESVAGTGIDSPRAPTTSRAWRWLAAAAAIVLVLAGGLALLTARGGHDEQQATAPPRESRAPKAAAQVAGVVDVGDFGDLDQAGNLAALRRALAAAPTVSPRPEASDAQGDTTRSEQSALGATPRSTCAAVLPEGTAVARATGTLDGRPVTVVLTERSDGARTLDAILRDPCEIRPLGNG